MKTTSTKYIARIRMSTGPRCVSWLKKKNAAGATEIMRESLRTLARRVGIICLRNVLRPEIYCGRQAVVNCPLQDTPIQTGHPCAPPPRIGPYSYGRRVMPLYLQ